MEKIGFTAKEISLLASETEEQYERLRGAERFRNADFIFYILSVILIAFAVRTFLAEPIRVDGDSMIPTLENGEHMFVEKLSYWWSEPARGDIVICYYPGYRESCVKRVIALPGETIRVSEGNVFINGVKIEESSYWKGMIDTGVEGVTVGEEEIFVMGDNRNGSKDSRFESVGCIPYKKVLGHVRAVVFPLNKFKSIPKETY